MPVAIALLKVLQALEYLVFINVKNIPSNVQFILNLVGEGNVFAGMASSIESVWQFDDGREESEDTEQQSRRRLLTGNYSKSSNLQGKAQSVCRTHKVLDSQEISCLGWNNVGSFVVQIIALFLFKGLFYLLSNLLLKIEKKKFDSMDRKRQEQSFKLDHQNINLTVKRGKIQKVIIFINDFLSFEFFVNFMLALELDILLGAFAGLKYGTYDNLINAINLLVSILSILFYAALTFIVGKKIFIISKKRKSTMDEVHKGKLIKTWEFLQEEVNSEISFASYIIALSVAKDFLFSPFIILGVSSNPVQIFPIITILVLISAFVVVKRPFKSRFENLTLIANNFCYIVILVLFYIINSQSGNMTQKERY